jgi:aldose 1-epimerase
MEKTLFANYNGAEIYEYIISNGIIEAHILNFGGILKNLFFDGVDVVCGFDTLDDYLADSTYQGARIGRYANRIKRAHFTLNGKEYNVGKNEGRNHLHGGISGFNRKVWSVKEATDTSITLSLFSPDGDEGFPGNLDVTVTYSLNESALCIDYFGRCDSDTVLNMTNHAYFNLNGCGNGTILDHKIKINANFATMVDEELIPTEQIEVTGSAFDLRSPTRIGDRINDDFIGYDHNFVIDTTIPMQDMYGFNVRKIAELANDSITMTVYTDQTDVQLYAGLTLGGEPIFKGGMPRVNYGALCLETQFEPDSPNKNKSILRANELYRHTTLYKFDKQ